MEYIAQDGSKVIPKESFEKKFKEIFKENYEEFIKVSITFLRKSIRVNTLKISVEYLKERLKKKFILKQVPWCREGFWIEHKEGRRDIGNLPEHQLGYFYVQEAASMLPPEVLKPEPGDSVLDVAASPGSKTTQMAAMMKNKGVIVSNDCNFKRIIMLGNNVQRCGASNVIITEMDGKAIKGNYFDKILLDAPCSATGALRKSLKTFKMWNPRAVEELSREQKKLIENAFRILKKRGVLVYSTCSVDPDENEEVVSWLLERNEDARLEEISLEIKRSKPFQKFMGRKYHESIEKCLRIHPQDNDTEGFFVAKIKRA
ncbi:MAG TPA: RsmB/NOP family class I SAM-dependent RNA methyltransferase [Candidatus Woesearchaeota archaeon]|nr:RsmB/NOP family class I SAM-dependent RNA methyltransferase [Candidatus Woesearchaeota archaeon]